MRRYVVYILIFFCFTGCSNTVKQEIIRTDLTILKADTTEGVTVSQRQEESKIFLKALEENTLNKYIPKDIKVENRYGNTFVFAELINRKTIVIASDLHCGLGKESIINDFPKAVDSLKEELSDYNIYCLIIKNDDFEEIKAKNSFFIGECSSIYKDNLFYINEDQAQRLNLYVKPTRLYFSHKGQIKNYASGLSNLDNQLRELKENAKQ